MEILGIVGIPAIAIICYMIGAACKAWDKFDDRKIPVLMMFCGAILGIVAYYFAPNLITAKDLITSIAVGIVSGAFATAVHQAIKQSQKGEEE